jgi:hypothetical protein
MEEPEDDYDYEEAHAAQLQSVYETQYHAYLENFDIFEDTFADFPLEECNWISKESRESMNFTSTTLSYGEIEFESFGALIAGLTKYEVDLLGVFNFVDLGSGIGKAVICAALLGIFEKCTGYELVPDLHAASNKALKVFNKHNQNNTNMVYVDYILGDCSFMDWSQADIVFLHGSCFDTETMARITDTCCKMKEKSIFISLSHR